MATTHGDLMCYNVLNQKGQIISRSSVQRVTQLELQPTEYKSMFETFDISIKDRLKVKDHTYNGPKPNPID